MSDNGVWISGTEKANIPRNVAYQIVHVSQKEMTKVSGETITKLKLKCLGGYSMTAGKYFIVNRNKDLISDAKCKCFKLFGKDQQCKCDEVNFSTNTSVVPQDQIEDYTPGYPYEFSISAASSINRKISANPRLIEKLIGSIIICSHLIHDRLYRGNNVLPWNYIVLNDIYKKYAYKSEVKMEDMSDMHSLFCDTTRFRTQ